MRTTPRSRFKVAGLAGLCLAFIMGQGPGDDKKPEAAPTAISPAAATAKPPVSDMVIHEWGTFLGMSGSDGTALEGMYHEEHALPAFVHARGRDQLRIPFVLLKGETPVIYFYTRTPQSVQIGVGFPKGIWTQWYPQARRVVPTLVEQAQTDGSLKHGRICWAAEIIPADLVERRLKQKSGEIPQLPATSADALWNHARDVDAAFVKTFDVARDPAVPEYERFLFYRGLGDARLPLRLSSARGGTLSVDKDPSLGAGIRHVYVIRIENGRGVFRYRPGLRPGWTVSGVIPSMDQAQPLGKFTQSIGNDLAARLTASGLFAKEARAMVNTWASSYFQTDGVRVLFVLPQSWTDAFIPMTVIPTPERVVRVMVGRIEMLTPEREQLAEAAVRSLAAPDAGKREQAFAFLREQGRYVEPTVRRVEKTTTDENVRILCRRLLLTDFVTDLRAAVHNAADGKRLNVNPLLLRDHLDRLLRELGLDHEKSAEAKGVQSRVQSMAEPKAATADARLAERARSLRP